MGGDGVEIAALPFAVCPDKVRPRLSTHVFLLSPAWCGGKRAKMLLNPAASFDLAVRLRRGTLSLGDALAADVSPATVVTLYMLGSGNAALRPLLTRQLRPGSRIVSHAFSMDEWEPDQKDMVDGRTVHYWMVPAKADGNWQVEISGRRVPLAIKQEFQMVTGTTTINGRAVPLSGRLTGEQIDFKADLGSGPTDYRGKVSGNTITGQNWRATR
jgi:hypothetical protein